MGICAQYISESKDTKLYTELSHILHTHTHSFPAYPKVERSYENFCKLKWHKTKKQLPSIYMEKS